MSSLPSFIVFFSFWAGRSSGREGAAIDDVLGAVDGSGPVGDQECDEFCGLGGMRGPADRDAAKGVHYSLQRRVPVDACPPGAAVDSSVGALGLNESGGHGVDPYAFRPDLVG